MQSEQSSRAQNLISRLHAFSYGGDYYPEQWTAALGMDEEATWQEDIRLMKLAHVNVVSLAVFSWVSLQPDEQTFTFDWLDRVMALLAENHIFVSLGTGTAAQPAWLSQNYPDVLPVNEQGIRKGHGGRQNYCPTSPDFRRLSRNLAHRLAERYGEHSALALWHVSNEYGPYCYCERCSARFRTWLQARYGSLDVVNRNWNTVFWSHTYTNWEQIIPPVQRTEESIQGLSLDYKRFMSEMNLECYRNEADILHEITPTIPVTTNLMGFFKPLDYFAWAPYLDIIAWDSYPGHTTPPAHTAFAHELMRGLKGGQSWLLMEQTPSQAQWRAYNPLKRPGILRLHSYQAVAHGSDAVMYFQWRQSRGSAEMFHGAIVSQAGHEHTRVFGEAAEIGTQLAKLGDSILGTRLPARVAVLFDWSNWWNVEYRPNLSKALNYVEEVLWYYQTLWERNIAVDVVAPDFDLSSYDLVLAPLLNMVSQEQAISIERFVELGGTFVTSYFSGAVNEHTLAWSGGAPGPLRRTLGIWVEEFDPLEPEMSNVIVVPEESKLGAGSYSCMLWCDLLHLEGATALAHFGEDFYAGRPAITEHAFGKGKAIYVATRPERSCIDVLLGRVLDDLAITSPLAAPAGVEVTMREGEGGKGKTFFVLNYTDETVTVPLPFAMRNLLTNEGLTGELHLEGKGVAIMA